MLCISYVCLYIVVTFGPSEQEEPPHVYSTVNKKTKKKKEYVQEEDDSELNEKHVEVSYIERKEVANADP